ncbi:hypothetical protein [Actinoplanes palleronii]|uniref:Uncharacterized protein n=1 Tax=Actinoplanes palleronii TaxID=113570 RepID=A0ABQ4BHK2_9ACTN|nr:hypothetical protein [Actinoplanes palleronii]GIE70160.1 hypothetical protein Apa02nite_062680 [Actinoplanes palleronii]
MGNPIHQEPTPERGDLTPELRHTRRRRTLIGVTGAATVLAGGAFLALQTRGTQQESLPEPPPMAAATGTAPVPSTPEVSASASRPVSAAASGSAPASVAASTDKGSAAGSAADEKPAKKSSDDGHENQVTKKSAKEIRKEIEEARAKAEADGFDLQRPPKAKGESAAKAGDAIKEWTEPTDNGSVRVTTARHDLTDSSTLLLAGDRGKSVGAGVNCTNKVRFTRDAPVTERPTLLMCWKTSSSRSVVTMMAAPDGKPSADDNISIIDREWAKLH